MQVLPVNKHQIPWISISQFLLTIPVYFLLQEIGIIRLKLAGFWQLTENWQHSRPTWLKNTDIELSGLVRFNTPFSSTHRENIGSMKMKSGKDCLCVHNEHFQQPTYFSFSNESILNIKQSFFFKSRDRIAYKQYMWSSWEGHQYQTNQSPLCTL